MLTYFTFMVFVFPSHSTHQMVWHESRCPWYTITYKLQLLLDVRFLSPQWPYFAICPSAGGAVGVGAYISLLGLP